MNLLHPEALLLLLPAVLVLVRWGFGRPVVAILRAAAVLCAVLLLAQPYLTSGEEGRDLVLLVDRSRSAGDAALHRAREVVAELGKRPRDGDRVSMVGFARGATLDAPPVDVRLARLDGALRDLDPDATDLALGIERALAAIPTDRPGSILVVSDGESTGRSPVSASRAALARGVRTDALPLRRGGTDGVAIESIETPGQVAAGEPFRVVAWVISDVARELPFELRRDGEVITRGTRTFAAGVDRIVFRDVLRAPGLVTYELRLEVEGDARPENDSASAPLRVIDAPRLLLVSPNGRMGRLADALGKASLPLDVVAPGEAPLVRDGLDPYAAVVLENIAADDLPRGAIDALADFVSADGGGLLMTGGERSFGLGGWRLSAVEGVLPVSMEIRQEQRRYAVALAIALDRSGSMMAPAGEGITKMDLANLGAAAAVETLSPIDEVAIIAVDSSPHVVVPLGNLADRGPVLEKIRRIESGGGGIFVGVAIDEMARQLEGATVRSRHMILFADAADSEEPAGSRELLPKLKQAGVTLSVIAMGTEKDSDARLLQDLARLGGGRCKFVADVKELPRAFAQETTELARSSFIDKRTDVAVRGGIVVLGDLGAASFPSIGGYSIAWARPQAQVALTTVDDVQAPLLATGHAGLGRAAAFLGEVDGRYTGELGAWSGFTDFFATLARWLAGSTARGALWAQLVREGHEGVLRVELGADAEEHVDRLRAAMRGPQGIVPLWLEQTDAGRFEARFPLAGAGTHRAVVQLGEREVARTAPIALPYSPEFEPRADVRAGERLLAEVAATTNGRVDPPLAELLDGRRDAIGTRFVGAWLAWALVVILVLEIACRRLELGPSRWRTASATDAKPRMAKPRAERVVPVAATAATTATAPEPPRQEPVAASDLDSVLERARKKAKRSTR
ncbi:MAG: VWA domain-containing protein [Planctomycetes bacterium]|nr:VWA domain-containing protein [Planctomycetota bacterium]